MYNDYNLNLCNIFYCQCNGQSLITVTGTVTPSVSITSASGNTNCDGATVTFTATPTDGGNSPSYQWKKGGSNVGTNSAILIQPVL